METVRTVASQQGPRGEVVLRHRSGTGPDVDELIVNGVFAMDSSETSTERELADLALAGQVQRRVLLGGLGLGYTAAQLLAGGVDHLDVIEIEQCLIEWAYAGVTPTLASVAQHPRVALHAGDISTVLAGLQPGLRGPWNAIVLDVDNGPDFLIHGANAGLYTEPSLAAAYGRLASGGTLAIWCQGPAPELFDVLRRLSASATSHLFQRVREGRQLTYLIYTGTRP
jgi:spermidine synthase